MCSTPAPSSLGTWTSWFRRLSWRRRPRPRPGLGTTPFGGPTPVSSGPSLAATERRGGAAGGGRAGLRAMGKVRIGFFSFTEVTDPAEHRSYNEWHQLDHMPEQYPIQGVAYGQRWVSTPACRRARAVDGAPLTAVHYMTLYLMGEPVDATLEEFRALGERLHAVGRFHEHRRARLSGPFVVTGMI